MIFDKLDCSIKNMRNLRFKENNYQKASQQAATDKKYDALVKQVHSFMSVLISARGQVDFILEEQTVQSVESLLNKLKKGVEDGYADPDQVNEANSMFKDIKAVVKKEWSDYYVQFTSGSLGTLKIIKNIMQDEADSCLKDIQAAESFPEDIIIVNKLNDAVLRSKILIEKLNLDQEIINFLNKMNVGRATMDDLNMKVISWIGTENLSHRIKLSFRNI